MIPLIYHPSYSFDFPCSHRFPMEKFALLYEYLRANGYMGDNNVYRPGATLPSVLEMTHDKGYVHRFLNNQQTRQEIRKMGLPWSPGLALRTQISPNGTLLTAHLALKHGVACHLAGGTHHAHFDEASGFCIFNDLAVTANALLATGAVHKVLIFDCDVHQGDGTARLLANEPRAVTCSIHCEKNFPVRKANSDCDVELPPGMADDEYLTQVEATLMNLLAAHQPDIVLYDAGVDIYEHDPLGLLSVTESGIRQRDYRVLKACHDHQVPIATVIGGGYDDDRESLAKRHALVIEQAFEVFAK